MRAFSQQHCAPALEECAPAHKAHTWRTQHSVLILLLMLFCAGSPRAARPHTSRSRARTQSAHKAHKSSVCVLFLEQSCAGSHSAARPHTGEFGGELLFFQCLDSYKTKTKKTRRKANKEKRNKKERKGGKQATNGWEKPVKSTLNCGINATHQIPPHLLLACPQARETKAKGNKNNMTRFRRINLMPR